LSALRADPAVQYDRTLYLAEWPALLAALKSAEDAGTPLLMIGHNPGLEQLALSLAIQPQDAGEQARYENLARKFPTAALAVLDFDEPDWGAIKPGTGRLTDFVRPRDLGASTS
jgi:phosphohistidine phosphatase